MASENNLTAVFTDIANAIRDKKGSVNTIKPINMADEILTISSGGEDTSGTNFYKYEPKGGTLIPNEGTTISRIYFNTNIKNIEGYITSLKLSTYDLGGSFVYPFLSNGTNHCLIGFAEGKVLIAEVDDEFQTIATFFDGTNWDSSLVSNNGVFEFSTPLTPVVNDNIMGIEMNIGTENEKIKSIISFDNSFSVEKVKCNNEDIINRNYCELESDTLTILTLICPNVKPLESVYLSSAISIGDMAFNNCPLLTTFVLRTNTICSLGGIDVFTNTLIDDSTTEGFIYVPDELVEQYKVATNWTTYASKIKGLSELPTE